MVQRQQTWHLPDPVDPAPVERGIGVYFTRVRLGGVDFAILEDRKFKSGPIGKIPALGPRPDHVGLGSDFDGVTKLPEQLKDVSMFPNITQELLNRGHDAATVRKMLGGNFMRVFREAEAAGRLQQGG